MQGKPSFALSNSTMEEITMDAYELLKALATTTTKKQDYNKCMVCELVLAYANGHFDAETAYVEAYNLRVRFMGNASALSQRRANRAFNMFDALRFGRQPEEIVEYWRSTP